MKTKTLYICFLSLVAPTALAYEIEIPARLFKDISANTSHYRLNLQVHGTSAGESTGQCITFVYVDGETSRFEDDMTVRNNDGAECHFQLPKEITEITRICIPTG